MANWEALHSEHEMLSLLPATKKCKRDQGVLFLYFSDT